MSTTITVTSIVDDDLNWEYVTVEFGLQNSLTLKGTAHTDAAARRVLGIRFPSIAIPQGRAIIAAKVQVQCINNSNDDANVTIYGNDVDDAADFVAEADVNNRALTAANVTWAQNSLGDAYVDSPELKTILQEIVDRGSWASGNAVMIIMEGKSDVIKAFEIEAYLQAGEQPILEVTYASARSKLIVIL